MFSVTRRAVFTRSASHTFPNTLSRGYHVSKLTLVGRLGKDPEQRTTKTGHEYIHYTVATENFPPPPAGPDGVRPPATTTWHSIMSFNTAANNYLKKVKKGSTVYVEANYEVRDPDPAADFNTPQGQRQIFLRHDTLRVLRGPSQGREQFNEEE